MANRWLAKLYRLDEQAADLSQDHAIGLQGLSGLTVLELAYIKAIAENQGQGLLMVTPDMLPVGWDRMD